MSARRCCGQCGHIGRTSAGQVFLRCGFWCRAKLRDAEAYVPDEWQDSIQSYVVLHCHMQPEAPACPAFRERREIA